jgi:hypothetical protein
MILSAATRGPPLAEAPDHVAARLPGQEHSNGVGGWYRMDKLFRADGAAAIFLRHYVPVAYLAEDSDPAAQDADWFQIGERFGRDRGALAYSRIAVNQELVTFQVLRTG